MNVLFLGGTGFVGRYMVSAAFKAGHHVTLFNRNNTNIDLFPEAERLVGNRDGNLEALQGRRWDVVIDVNGYLPRLVRDSAALLQHNVDRYVFISAANACDCDKARENGFADEDTPRSVIVNQASEEYWGADYGGLKALCELEVEKYFPDSSSILRLGVVAGPHDPTDRVTYWVDRVARGGEILVPALTEDPIRFIDVRDLADFTLKVIENRLDGIFHTLGKPLSWQGWLDACQSESGSDVTYRWVNDANFIGEYIDLQQRPFGTLPMMFEGALEDIDWRCDKAVAAGLEYSDPAVTARDILAWHKTRQLHQEESSEQLALRAALDWDNKQVGNYWMAGLTVSQESELLVRWAKH
jgi:2'-hydroxyisoflavone reductase